MALTSEDLQAIAGLLEPMNHRLDKMDGRLDKMDSRLDKMDIRLDKMDIRLNKMDIRLNKMDNRLDKMESEISALKVGQIGIRKELKELDQKISDTYQVALNAWGISTENRNWLTQIESSPF